MMMNGLKKKSQQLGIAFLVTVITNVLFSFLMVCVLRPAGIDFYWGIPILLCEAGIVIPAIWYARKQGEGTFFERIGLSGIKISTGIKALLYGILVFPLFALANSISLLFTSNIMMKSAGTLFGGSILESAFFMMILAPICEEIMFRGTMARGYGITSGTWKSIFLSALLFGLIHLNLNQFCYAFAVGICAALINEASGSILTSILVHFMINGIGVFTGSLTTSNYTEEQLAAISSPSLRVVLSALAVYGVLCLICLPLAFLLLRSIAKKEGRIEHFGSLFGKRKDAALPEGEEAGADAEKVSVFSIPLVAGILIAAVTIILGGIGF